MTRLPLLLVLLAFVLCGKASPSAVDLRTAIFAAISSLQPSPPSWDLAKPLDQWQYFTTSRDGEVAVVDINIDASHSFTAGIFNLSALSTSFPLTSISLDSLPEVEADLLLLPQCLKFFQVANSPNGVRTSTGHRSVNLTALPPLLQSLVLRNNSLSGVVDLTFFRRNIMLLDLSHNPGIVGGVDLSSWPIGDAAVNILLHGTNISYANLGPIPLAIIQQGYVCRGAPQLPCVDSFPDHCQLKVRANSFTNPIPYDVYCLQEAPSSLNSDFWRMSYIEVYRIHAPVSLDAMRLYNGVTGASCNFVLPARSFGPNGYFIASVAWTPHIINCIEDTLPDYIYAVRPPTPLAQIQLRNLDGSTTRTFSTCPSGADDPYSQYFSASVSSTLFFDWTNRALTGGFVFRVVDAERQFVRNCSYPWPLFTHFLNNIAPSIGGNGLNAFFNQERVVNVISPCFPVSTVTFSGYDQRGKKIFIFTNNDTNTPSLEMPMCGYQPMPTADLCYATPTRVFHIQISATSLVAFGVNPDGSHTDDSNWTGIPLFVGSPRTNEVCSSALNAGSVAYADRIIGELSASLPVSSSGAWDANRTSYDASTSSLTFRATDGSLFAFNPSECAAAFPKKAFCSATVDFGRSELAVDFDQNSAVTMRYISRIGAYPLLVQCGSHRDLPVWIIRGTGDLVVGATELASWSSCIPIASATSYFGTLRSLTFYESGVLRLVGTQTTAIELGNCSIVDSNKNDRIGECNSTLSILPRVGAASASYCFGDYCESMRSIRLHTHANAAWRSQVMRGGQCLAVPRVAPLGLHREATLSACYPGTCAINVSSCTSIASVILETGACLIANGYPTQNMTFPAISGWEWDDDFAGRCEDNATTFHLISAVTFLRRTPAEQLVQFHCAANGPVFATCESASTPALVLGTVWGRALQLDAKCTPCVPLFGTSAFPTPFILIAISACLNIIFVLLSNWVLDPVIAPRLIGAKACIERLLGHSGRTREEWRRQRERRLRPVLMTAAEVKIHVDMLVAFICDLPDSNRGRGWHAPSTVSLSNRQTSDIDAELLQPESSPESGDVCSRHDEIQRLTLNRVRIAYEAFIMERGDLLVVQEREQGSSGEGIPMRVVQCLVALRDACHDLVSPRSDSSWQSSRGGSEPPNRSLTMRRLQKSSLFQMERVLLGTDALHDGHSEIDVDALKLVSRTLLDLERCLSAEWCAFVLDNEWLDRRSLIPRDWLLTLQLGVTLLFFIAFIIEGLRESPDDAWMAFTYVYFRTMNSSLPATVMVNSAFRALFVGVRQSSRVAMASSALHKVRLAFRNVIRDGFVLAVALLLAPALVIFVMPGLAIFPFVVVVAVAVVSLAQFAVWFAPRPTVENGHLTLTRSTMIAVASRLLFRGVTTFAIVLTMQIGFNYAALVYTSDHSYTGVMATDYSSRSIACEMEQVAASGSSALKTVATFFG